MSHKQCIHILFIHVVDTEDISEEETESPSLVYDLLQSDQVNEALRDFLFICLFVCFRHLNRTEK